MKKPALLIALSTLASASIFAPSSAHAFELSTTQKLQLVATQAQAQDLFFLSGFLDGETKNQGIQSGFLNSSSFSLNPQGTIKDTDYTANYLGTFDSNSDLVNWTMTGNYGQRAWSSSGTAKFQNNNEEIIWNSNGSINPDWEVKGGLKISLGGNQPLKYDFSLGGGITDKVGNRGGKYDLLGSISKDSENGFSTGIKGKYEETNKGTSKQIQVESKTNKNGTTITVQAKASSVPEPLTILGSITALGFGIGFKCKQAKAALTKKIS
ncbi:MAG: PEP-CTERM sorting domain-containing protein [Gloeotrichia echinulata CP02]|jgi:hypothetical protein